MFVRAGLLAVWLVAGQLAPAQIATLLDESRAAASGNDQARAEQTFREALELLARVPAGHADEAGLNELVGDAAVRRGDLELADRLYSRSLAALTSSQRQTVAYARVSKALAAVTASRNQLSRAHDLYDVALKAYEALGADSLELAHVLDNAGILEMRRRQLPTAESMFRRSLAIKHAHKAAASDVGSTQGHLGLVLLEQGRLDEAATALRLATDQRRSHAPPLEMAALVSGLARVERLRGQTEAATAAGREAVGLHRAERSPTLAFASALYELAMVRESARAYDEALGLHREALGIREKLAPQSAEVAESLDRVAITTAMAGDPIAAVNAFGRAIDTWARLSANSVEHATAIHELGLFLLRRGDQVEGLRRLREAVGVLEAAFAKGSDVTDVAPARIQAIYHAPIRQLAERGDAGEAFSLLDRLNERLRRSRCAACETPPAPADPVDALKRGIEPGTLVVAFSVQPAATYAFVASRDTPMRVYRIDEKSDLLSDRVQRFVERVRTPAAGAAYEAPLVAAGRALFNLLFGQFEDDATEAERLLIVPDAALDTLPFSALSRNRSGKWQYLADWKPMAFAPSVAAAVSWTGGSGVSPGPLAELLVKPGGGSSLVNASLNRGALVSLWTLADSTTARFVVIVKTGVSQGSARASAVARAQRVMRTDRDRSHPSHWAGFRYYGAQGIR